MRRSLQGPVKRHRAWVIRHAPVVPYNKTRPPKLSNTRLPDPAFSFDLRAAAFLANPLQLILLQASKSKR